MTTQKETFIAQLRDDASAQAQILEKILPHFGIYFDRGYNVSGSDPITEADAETQGTTLATITAMVTLLENLDKFANNQIAATADYMATLSKARRDL